MMRFAGKLAVPYWLRRVRVGGHGGNFLGVSRHRAREEARGSDMACHGASRITAEYSKCTVGTWSVHEPSSAPEYLECMKCCGMTRDAIESHGVRGALWDSAERPE
eukprot:gene12695-biopygen7771